MMIPAIIVDDDRINIKFLSNLILTYCPEISIVETATNVEDGIKALVLHKPQLLFLDIEIHSQTGFDILNLFEDASIQVIFITAHEKYAIKAIQYEVVDYVLKPIKIEDLLAAVKRCKVRLQSLQEPRQKYHTAQDIQQVLSIHHKESIELIRYNEIIFIQSFNNHTEIFTNQGKKIVTKRALKEIYTTLPSTLFIRVHNSYIINIMHVSKYIRTKNGTLLMSSGIEIPISSSKKKEVMDYFNF